MKHLKYLKYVLRHKWFVFIECCKLGIPWRGIKHDWTKFLPIEWFGYVERFQGGNSDYDKAMESEIYRQAWLHHQNHNDHHWQYWALVQESGKILCLPMPERCRREMLADWRGMGRAFGTDTREWYMTNQGNMQLHKDTRRWVHEQFGYRLWDWEIFSDAEFQVGVDPAAEIVRRRGVKRTPLKAEMKRSHHTDMFYTLILLLTLTILGLGLAGLDMGVFPLF